MNLNKIKLALIGCGTGHVYRGFEVSASRWYQALSYEDRLDVKLFCGGKYPGGTLVWNCPRDSFLAQFLCQVGLLDDGYRIEQASFTYSFLFYILRWQPNVIWTQEPIVARLLKRFRKKLNLQYKIIFCDGSPQGPSFYKQFDFIQLLTSDAYDEGKQFGIPLNRMQVLPYCVPYKRNTQSLTTLRKTFGYTDKDWIIVCVAAWNRKHKRIDYLIHEVAAMKDPQVKLLLCGQTEAETSSLKTLGQEKLEGRIQWLTLPPDEVNHALWLADIFVLPSLNEGLGAVLIEAAMAGLPIVSHPHAGSRFILQDDFWMTDLSQVGSLTKRLIHLRANPPALEKAKELQTQVIDRFSERGLTPQFYEMVKKVTTMPLK